MDWLCCYLTYWLYYMVSESCVVWWILKIQMSLGFNISNLWLCTLYFLQTVLVFKNAWVHFIVVHLKLVAAVELLLNESNYQANWLLAKLCVCCLLSVWTLSKHIQFSDTVSKRYIDYTLKSNFFIYSCNDELSLETILKECYIYIWRLFVVVNVKMCVNVKHSCVMCQYTVVSFKKIKQFSHLKDRKYQTNKQTFILPDYHLLDQDVTCGL